MAPLVNIRSGNSALEPVLKSDINLAMRRARRQLNDAPEELISQQDMNQSRISVEMSEFQRGTGVSLISAGYHLFFY